MSRTLRSLVFALVLVLPCAAAAQTGSRSAPGAGPVIVKFWPST